LKCKHYSSQKLKKLFSALKKMDGTERTSKNEWDLKRKLLLTPKILLMEEILHQLRLVVFSPY